MATTNAISPNHLDKLSWYQEHCPHAVWDQFDARQRNDMVAEDLAAGASVSLVLASLIAAGLVLSLVTLLAVLASA